MAVLAVVKRRSARLPLPHVGRLPERRQCDCLPEAQSLRAALLFGVSPVCYWCMLHKVGRACFMVATLAPMEERRLAIRDLSMVLEEAFAWCMDTKPALPSARLVPDLLDHSSSCPSDGSTLTGVRAASSFSVLLAAVRIKPAAQQSRQPSRLLSLCNSGWISPSPNTSLCSDQPALAHVSGVFIRYSLWG